MSGDRLLGAYELKNYKKLAGFMHGVCYSKIPANHIIDVSTQPGMIIPYLPSGNLTIAMENCPNRNRWFTYEILLNRVIFHGELLVY